MLHRKSVRIFTSKAKIAVLAYLNFSFFDDCSVDADVSLASLSRCLFGAMARCEDDVRWRKVQG